MSRPKHSNELEQRVLENLMSLELHTNMRAQKAMLKLTPDCFYIPSNARIFGLISHAFKNKETFNYVDILLKIDRKDNDLHDAFNVIMDNYRTIHVNNNSLENDITKIIALRDVRKQMAHAVKMINEASECIDPLESQNIISSHSKEIITMNQIESKHGISTAEISEAFYNGEIKETVKIPTDCQQLNEKLQGGVIPKTLIFAAAAPSVGKTGFSIFLADKIARAQPGSECLYFSLEMEYKHIWMRHVGICAGKPFDKLNEEERRQAIGKAMMVPMTIYDTSMCRNADNLDFIITTSMIKAMDKKISVVVVDYLDLVKVKGTFERNDLKIFHVNDKLKDLAKDLDCNVILLSQINRGAANRSEDDRCPWPHDAANGSGGNNAASLWLGLDRPALYRHDDPIYENQFVVKCRKNRFGDIFDLMYGFNNGTFGEYIPSPNYRRFAPKRTTEEELFC